MEDIKLHFVEELVDEHDAILSPTPLSLSHALRHPHEVSDLLFSQLEVRVEDPIVELLVKCEDAPLHLLREKHLQSTDWPAHGKGS